jgi:hypothetical protein
VKHSLQQPASPLSPLSRSLLLLAPKHVLAQCLALGCVLTILFAYVPLLFAHKYKWDGEKSVAPKWSLEPTQQWKPAWPVAPDAAFRHAHVGYTIQSAHYQLDALAASKRLDPSITLFGMLERRIGLPLPCVRRIDAFHQVMRTITQEDLPWWRKGITSPAWFANGYALRERIPIEPLLLPLLFNIIYWSLLSFALRQTATTLIARRRKAKGLCPNCAYPNAASPCPECGYNATTPNPTLP